MLRFLSAQSSFNLWVIFAAENLLVTLLALLFGWLILKLTHKPIQQASRQEIWVCLVTNAINTVITYAGFWLWKNSYVVLSYDLSWRIILDFFVLFILMDLAMFIFHYVIHHSTIYKTIHRFHHHYTDPTPIDLFVLHPFETVGFGSLWLLIITLISFNLCAVFIYLIANVFFGIMGHLGVEPIPLGVRKLMPFKYLGTSSFHHMHHQDINYNYGFYTNIWDKLFKTYKEG